MGRHNTMGIFTADRKATALQVAYALIEHLIGGAVVDGKLHTNTVNFQVANHTVFRYSEGFVIAGYLGIVYQRIFGFVKSLVIGVGSIKDSGIFLRIQVIQNGFVICDSAALGLTVPEVTEDRV